MSNRVAAAVVLIGCVSCFSPDDPAAGPAGDTATDSAATTSMPQDGTTAPNRTSESESSTNATVNPSEGTSLVTTSESSSASSSSSSSAGEAEAGSSGNPQPTYNIAFVTSTSHTGNLGGIAGADQICTDRAIEAGLVGSYIAYIGTTTSPRPRMRLEGARGWVRTDGRPVLDEPDGQLLFPLRIDESGERNESTGDVGGDIEVWTGERRNSIIALANCADWTSASAGNEGTAGYADAVSTDFFDGVRDPCSFARRLYCFGIDHDTPLEVAEESGRLAFFADISWDGFGGFDSADSRCQQQANMAGLGGNYLALLSGTSITARARFNLNGERWVRTDGIALAPTAAAFFDDALWAVPLNVEADGSVPPTPRSVWTGPGLNNTGSNSQTCSNWTGSSDGQIGRSSRSDKQAAVGSNTLIDCGDSGAGLYCLEQ